MAVSPSHRPQALLTVNSVETELHAQTHIITYSRALASSHTTCRPRTRESVRRASGFVQISITLINPDFLVTSIIGLWTGLLHMPFRPVSGEPLARLQGSYD